MQLQNEWMTVPSYGASGEPGTIQLPLEGKRPRDPGHGRESPAGHPREK
jgi:hypothetical protein